MTAEAGGQRHTYPGRVAWVDTDAGGRIHFTAVLRWAEAAEHDLLRTLGHSFHGGFPRVDVRAAYRAPLRFDDEFTVELGISKVGTSSIAYEWQIRSGGGLAVEGRHHVVFVGTGERPTPLPDVLRGQLMAMLPPPSSGGDASAA